MIRIVDVNDTPMLTINLILLLFKKILYAQIHTKIYATNVAMTETLANCSKLCQRNRTSVQAATVTSIVATAGVPLGDNSLNVRRLSKDDIFCSTLDAASMYVFTADNIAINSNDSSYVLGLSLEISLEAVARGAGESARILLPVEPISKMFKNIHTNPTMIIVILIDLYTIFSAVLVSWAGIAHISNPVIGK
jgi:hypothetical protein